MTSTPLPERPPHPDPADWPEQAEGSGVAAIIAFFDIVACGMIGFLGYRMLGAGTTASLSSLHLAWMYFLPATLAIALDLPTDPLTRGLCRVAKWFGILGYAMAAGALALVATHPARQVEGASVAMVAVVFAGSTVGSIVIAIVARRLAARALARRLDFDRRSGGEQG